MTDKTITEALTKAMIALVDAEVAAGEVSDLRMKALIRAASALVGAIRADAIVSQRRD